MSESKTGAKTGQMKATERITQGGGPGRGPGGGMVGQKADSFGPSARRLLARLRPARGKALSVIVLGIGSVASVAVGPWILGKATDAVFNGFI
ncbi:MAG: ABC transporter ATP-binding protein, partial [Nocardioidaceae bacterium]|nr:ABC transporter ATP-binding protein [Nocardioidaceae bacterium]